MLSDFCLEPPITKKGKKQRDDGPLQQKPIVFHGQSVYVFVQKCSKQINKFLRDVCDPVSKPQKVHEYVITKQSLVRAQALGYKKNDIVSMFKRNMRNTGQIPIDLQRKISDYVKQCQCQLYLQWNGQTCFHLFKINKQLYESIKKEIGFLLIETKQQSKQDKNCAIFKVVKFQHSRLQQILLKWCMPVRADRKVQAFIPTQSKFKSGINGCYCHNIQINLKSFTQLRQYQAEALSAIVKTQNQQIRAKSGYVVLPCGAGKTLLGISILCKIKKQTLIVCSSDSGTEQWKRQIEKWTQNFPREHIVVITSQNKIDFKNSQHGQIFISTYSFLKTHIAIKKQTDKQKQKQIKRKDQWLINKPWGLIIFDQCQTLPATQNRQIIPGLLAQSKIGLTATPLRQDDEIKALNFMIGPQLYVGDWKTFVQQGYLANPKCIQIRTQLTPFFRQKYKKFTQNNSSQKINVKSKREMCYKINPNKVKALIYLLHHHQHLKDNILVFSDDIDILNFVAEKLGKPVLAGSAKAEERMFIFDMFRQGIVKTLFLSRIGDQAIDLPNANVGIQLNIHHGSRKQMLQRLGRIMRQKQASTSMSYNAMFYTITTYDTFEWKYFFNRYKCLINEGFHYDLRLFQFRPKQIDQIQNILELDNKVRQQIDKIFENMIGNQQQYWEKFVSYASKN